MPQPIANAMELVVFAAAHPHACVEYETDYVGANPEIYVALEHAQCALAYAARVSLKTSLSAPPRCVVAFADAGDAHDHSRREVYGALCTECGKPLYPED